MRETQKSELDQPTNHYLLFGEAAAKDYDDRGYDFIKRGLLKDKYNHSFSLYRFIEGKSSIRVLLDAACGWLGYIFITQNQYIELSNILKKKANEPNGTNGEKEEVSTEAYGNEE